MSSLATYILAGGKSERFGGDKARAEFIEGRSVLEFVVERSVNPILVVDSPGRYRDLVPTPEVLDLAPGQGPAMAIATALGDARARGFERIRIVSCDMPTFDPAWWQTLEEAPAAAAAFRDAYWQPLFSTWRVDEVSIPDPLPRAARGLLEAVGAQAMTPPSNWSRLVSINTPESLLQAREAHHAAEHGGHVQERAIRRYASGAFEDERDVLAVEEPLEIRLGFQRPRGHRQEPVSITMRTPGNDFELALGFLFGERLINSPEDVADVVYCGDGRNQNVVRVELSPGVEPDLMRLQRNFYTTSSCGVCGKSSLEALRLTGYATVTSEARVSAEIVGGLPARVREAQHVFERTGGLHAAGLFDLDGKLLCVREDVGRHNALDKLVGASWRTRALPWSDRIVVLSGRASFELLQKAISAGAPFVVAVGAPSSLAVELAEMYGVTLAGFTQGTRFNLYAHPERVVAD